MKRLSFILAALRDTGDYPAWLWEWSDMITQAEYNRIVPKAALLQLPRGELLRGMPLPDECVSAARGV